MRTIVKRRREKKTDYKARRILLKSGKNRIVIRRTNRYFEVQLVESHEAQDKVLVGVNSKQLLENGWDKKLVGSLKSTPAAYLTGLLLAKKISDKKDEVILDIGMARHISGSRIYAVAKGLVDGGVSLKINESVFPSEEKLVGKKELKAMISKVKEKLK
jgi:large subunit ribosomal protein L18